MECAEGFEHWNEATVSIAGFSAKPPVMRTSCYAPNFPRNQPVYGEFEFIA